MGFFRTWWLVTMVASCVTLVAPRASATTDSGFSSRLLALAGPKLDWAILADEDIHDGCGELNGFCELYLNRVGTPFRRVHVLRVEPQRRYTDSQLLTLYLGHLPRNLGRRLRGRDVSVAKVPTFHGRIHAPNSVLFHTPRGVWEAALRTRWTSPSMAPYDALSGNLCWNKGRPACSNCHKVLRWVDGERRWVWQCAAKRGMRTGKAHQACRCDARARRVQLSLRSRADPAQGSTQHATGVPGPWFRGRQALIEPHALAQNTLNGPGAPLSTLVSLDYAGAPSVRLHLVEDSLVVVGSVSHEPLMNGTFFPIAATAKLTPKGNPAKTKRAKRR